MFLYRTCMFSKENKENTIVIWAFCCLEERFLCIWIIDWQKVFLQSFDFLFFPLFLVYVSVSFSFYVYDIGDILFLN